MQPIRPMLGEIELQQVQQIEIDGDQVLTRHDIPGLEGDFLQQLGRRGSTVSLSGVLSGVTARESLTELRDRFRNAEPVSFAADLASATRVDEVLIEDMQVTERAGHPDCFAYAFRLREFTPAEPIDPEVPPEIIIEPEEATLVVNVVVVGEPAFDFSGVTVTLSGTSEEGEQINNLPMTNRQNNRWTEQDFEPGSYTVVARAVAEGMTGSEEAVVREGETTEITIELSRGVPVAPMLIVHYRFDSSFVEPCLRAVLRQIAERANAGEEKLLIVGNTDLAGSPEYNQSLSERRARGVFSFLRFGNDPDAAVNEWNELRRTRTPGTTRSLNDTWGTREYQQMLQDLGFYTGQIHGRRDTSTVDAVKAFQLANGLTDDGDVGDLTWPVLIRAYLAQDNLSIPDSAFLPNCEGEFLRWLGCGELDPIIITPLARRQNRRTEFLFTTVTELPTDVAQPDTFNLPASQGGWCLNDSNTTRRCCWVVPHATQQNPPRTPTENCDGVARRGPSLERTPAEPQPAFQVIGSIRFEDGTPLANTEFVLTAPDGEYLAGEQDVTANGIRAGTPFTRRTGPNGEFQFDQLKTPGIFIMEIHADVVARAVGQPLEDAKGPVVCKRLEAPADRYDVIVVGRAAAHVRPLITAPDVVLVPQPGTNPARQPVQLSVDAPFNGTGAVTIDSDQPRLRLFDAPAAGNELTFDGVDNVFTSDQLVTGVTLFAAGGPQPSATADDVEIVLALTVGGQPGFADREPLTAVRVTVDIGEDRQIPFIDPPMVAAAQKANPGRPLQVQTPERNALRALVIVRRAEPADFGGSLRLSRINGLVSLFAAADELAVGSGPALGDSVDIVNTAIPEPAPGLAEQGARFWLEANDPSAAVRNTGLLLGVDGVDDGDRVLVTNIRVEMATQAVSNGSVATAIQAGLWDNAFTSTNTLRNANAEASNFVGADTRHFFVRAVDVNAANRIVVRWQTLHGDGSDDDRRGNAETNTLVATGANNTFLSRALMIVTDAQDRGQATNTGLGTGNAGVGAADHRLRRITVSDDHPLDQQVVARYEPAGFAAGSFTMSAVKPMFQRTPEFRRRIRIRLINVRDRVGGTGALGNARRDQTSATIRAIHAVAGIFAEVVEPVTIDPPASCTGWGTRYADADALDPGVESFSTIAGVLTASPSQTDIIDVVRNLASFDPDDIYVVFVARIYDDPIPAPTVPPSGGLVRGSRGQSFPDSFAGAGNNARGFTFVALRNNPTIFTEVHEITHVTTNLRNDAGGHFELPDGNTPPDDPNLMRQSTDDTQGVASTKRIWNTDFNSAAVAPSLLPAQIDAIRGSRFVRPY